MDNSDVGLVFFIIAIGLIVGGILWFFATLESIPTWAWPIIVGAIMLAILYVLSRVSE